MRAAVLEQPGRPLALRELDEPRAEPGQVLVRVRAAGLGLSELEARAGRADGASPVVPGREIAGEVLAGAAGPEAGKRVAVYPYEFCGSCRRCRSGTEQLCRSRARLGHDRPGGFAETIAVDARNALPIGDVGFDAAAVAVGPIAAAWRALEGRARVRAEERVLVVGAGSLGLHAVQVARVLGARVAAIDPRAVARRRATSLGAELAITPSEADLISGWRGDGIDVVLEASGRPEALAPALDGLAPGARLVCCGHSDGATVEVATRELVAEEQSILGSLDASREETQRALAAVEAGEMEPVIDARLPLELVNEGLDAIAAGVVVGRLVVTLD